jgi:hypothetical protein
MIATHTVIVLETADHGFDDGAASHLTPDGLDDGRTSPVVAEGARAVRVRPAPASCPLVGDRRAWNSLLIGKKTGNAQAGLLIPPHHQAFALGTHFLRPLAVMSNFSDGRFK